MRGTELSLCRFCVVIQNYFCSLFVLIKLVLKLLASSNANGNAYSHSVVSLTKSFSEAL